MHMSDALVSPPVFIAAAAVSVTLIAVAVAKVKKTHNTQIVPLMGVMGAFVFAAQMINFSIPGTGSSGHIVGGILLAATLGPWAALLALSSVLVLQSLIFADGGFMALGCNILNMAVLSCLVAYPLIYRPLAGSSLRSGRIALASIVACIVGLELGAAAVTLETEISGITALPTGRFLLFMLPIHLLIGLGEGLATAAVLGVVQHYKPELLVDVRRREPSEKRHFGKALAVIAAAALVVGGSFTWIASSYPDGLEWAIGRMTGGSELAATHADPLYRVAENLQQTTALIPDYNTTFAGIVGCGAILLTAFGVSYLAGLRHRKS